MCSDWQPGDKIQMWAFITLGTHINTRHPRAALWIANSFAMKKNMHSERESSHFTCLPSPDFLRCHQFGLFFAVLLLANGLDSLPFSVALISLGLAQSGCERRNDQLEMLKLGALQRDFDWPSTRDKLCLGWTLMVYSTARGKPGEFDDERNYLQEKCFCFWLNVDPLVNINVEIQTKPLLGAEI